MSETRDRVRSVLREHGRLSSDVDAVADDASLYDAGLTSLACVNVMLALEDHFDVEFPEKLLKRATFESIDNLAAAVGSLVDAGV